MKKRLKDKLHAKKNAKQSAEETPDAPITPSQIAEKIRAGFDDLRADLHKVIDRFDDEELLRLGKESAAYKDVVKIVEIRDQFFAHKNQIPAADRPDELVADLNRVVKEAWQKLDEKWKSAEQHFPVLAESLRNEWGNIKIEADRSPFQIELEELKENFEQAQILRAQVGKALEENPDNPEAVAVVEELDAAFEAGKRRMSKLTAQTFRQLIVNIYEELNNDIANTGDEALIESIADTSAAYHIRQYADVMARSEPALKNLHPNDKPEEIITIFNRTIVESRQKLKEKRAAAEARNPRLKKEYPMDESYNKALADLLEAIKTRDEMAETLKIAPPEKRPEGLRLLQEMDKKIEGGEQLLANEYQAFQNHARAIDALRDEVKLASDEELKHLRQFLKENPAEMIDLQKLLAEEFPE